MNEEIKKEIEVDGEKLEMKAVPDNQDNELSQMGNGQYNMGRDNYTIANNMNRGRSLVRRRTFDAMGPKNRGFAQVAILATVICIAGLVIAYFAFRF